MEPHPPPFQRAVRHRPLPQLWHSKLTRRGKKSKKKSWMIMGQVHSIYGSYSTTGEASSFQQESLAVRQRRHSIQRCQRYDTERDVAVKLSQKKYVLMSFLSPSCGLCASLERELDKVGTGYCSSYGNSQGLWAS